MDRKNSQFELSQKYIYIWEKKTSDDAVLITSVQRAKQMYTEKKWIHTKTSTLI